jgi:hypothetical protein
VTTPPAPLPSLPPQSLKSSAELIGEYEAQSQDLGARVVEYQLEADRSRQDVSQLLAELHVSTGRPPDAPLPAELHAQVVETSTRARFMVDSLRNLAEAHEAGEFRDSVMQLLTERRLIAS